MVVWSIHIAFVILGVALLLSAYRVCVGPTVLDRTAAFGTISANLIGLIALWTLQSGLDIYLDLAIVLALLAFVGSVAIAKFIVRGVIIERRFD